MSTLRKVLHEYRFHVWSSELRRPVMNANKTWRAKWFELVLKVTDPRFYSMAAADNQRIQKWSGMRWLMIDDTNIRNTLQCKFQLNIPLRLSFFFFILMYSGSNYTSILRGMTAKLWQRSSAIKTTITHSTEVWADNRRCLRRSKWITMFCHGWQQKFSYPSRCNATFKRQQIVFHWRSAGYLLNFFGGFLQF